MSKAIKWKKTNALAILDIYYLEATYAPYRNKKCMDYLKSNNSKILLARSDLYQ